MLYLNQNHIDILTKHVPCPVRLNLELTTECNFSCIMCRGSVNYKKKNKTQRHLSGENFINFLKGVDLNRLKILNLAGNSEPLLNPDILQIIAICRELKIIIEIITNGMLLTPDVAKLLLGCSSEVHVSFAGATKGVFESIRRGADFDRICENIRYLSRLKAERHTPFPRIWINPILMKRNMHQLPEMVRLAKRLGGQGVACSHLGVDNLELIGESLFFHKKECNRLLMEAQATARENDILFVAPAPFRTSPAEEAPNTEPVEAWRKCRFLWNHCILGVERIVPCGGADFSIDFDGNVVRNRFLDIWNNDWYSAMRYRLLAGNPPEDCINCNDPSVMDVNYMGSYFQDEALEAVLNKDDTIPAEDPESVSDFSAAHA